MLDVVAYWRRVVTDAFIAHVRTIKQPVANSRRRDYEVRFKALKAFAFLQAVDIRMPESTHKFKYKYSSLEVHINNLIADFSGYNR